MRSQHQDTDTTLYYGHNIQMRKWQNRLDSDFSMQLRKSIITRKMKRIKVDEHVASELRDESVWSQNQGLDKRCGLSSIEQTL